MKLKCAKVELEIRSGILNVWMRFYQREQQRQKNSSLPGLNVCVFVCLCSAKAKIEIPYQCKWINLFCVE